MDFKSTGFVRRRFFWTERRPAQLEPTLPSGKVPKPYSFHFGDAAILTLSYFGLGA